MQALKSKITPWENLHGIQPQLEQEQVWESQTFVTYPHKIRRLPGHMQQMENEGFGHGKLTEPHSWMGYFVGCESESIYQIWDPEKKTVVQVFTANINDGSRLDNDQNEHNSCSDQVPISDMKLKNDEEVSESSETKDKENIQNNININSKSKSMSNPLIEGAEVLTDNIPQ